MDFGTVFGLLASGLAVIATIWMSGQAPAYLDLPSLVLVAGGTLAVAFVTNRAEDVMRAFAIAGQAFLRRPPALDRLIPLVVDLAQHARKEGLISLEDRRLPDPFLERGIRMCVDGINIDTVRDTLQRELVSLRDRHRRGQRVFRMMASTAPALGMIGTLLGMVAMLRTIDDPSKIGPGMAIAFLTTLYGAVLAYVVFGPIAEKLEERTREELVAKSMIITAIESIVHADSRIVIQNKLGAFLAPPGDGRSGARR